MAARQPSVGELAAALLVPGALVGAGALVIVHAIALLLLAAILVGAYWLACRARQWASAMGNRARRIAQRRPPALTTPLVAPPAPAGRPRAEV